MDFITRGVSRQYALRFLYVEVTATARELARRHQSGPAAAKALALGLTAVALLSVDLSENETAECISLQLSVTGPLRGVMVEATAGGSLRGYTDVKVLHEIDGEGDIDVSPALGGQGTMTVIHSSRVKVLHSAHVRVKPADFRTSLARYYNDSRQTPTAVELFARHGGGQVERAAGLIADKMTGGNTEKFVAVLERFHDGSAREHLESATGLAAFKELFAVNDLEIIASSDLRFECRCDYQKTRDALATLRAHELAEILKKGEAQRVVCHFCGETYTVPLTEVHRLLADKGGG